MKGLANWGILKLTRSIDRSKEDIGP